MDAQTKALYKQQQEIQALKAYNQQVEQQSLIRELAHIKNMDPEKVKEQYKEHSNRDLEVLVKELSNNPDFAVFTAQKKEEKPPLVFYAGTYQRGSWGDEKEESAA